MSISVAVYAMFATEGPPISADGLQAAADLTSPSTASQPQLSTQYQSSVASAQDVNVGTPLTPQDRLEALAVATPTPGAVSSSLAAPSPTPTATPLSECEPASAGLYCVYTVKSGDTLSAIARRFGLQSTGDLSPAEMLAHSNKPAVVETNSIETGLKLRIPSESGIIHTVFSNETLSDIASVYGVDVDEIKRANAALGPSLLVGQNILVPDPQRIRLPVAPAATAVPAETPTPEPTATEPVATVQLPASSTPGAAATTPTARRGTATPPPKPATPVSKAGFIWPAQGPISSYFGPAHPLGIDIDFYANPNQAVVAAAAGTVTFAGGDACCSYGYYVIVDHGNGFQTLYAHFSRFAVSAGAKVTQGQILGYGGQTGYSTGYHLHFEVHLNGAIVNPLTYLP